MKSKIVWTILGTVAVCTVAALVLTVLPHELEWPDWLVVLQLLH